ncbi:MAG: hypothetical protein M3001_12350 [Staphylococcus epidermidis]|nr:hypothetical protein [Staphylococcus epidermidis]
MTKEFNILNVYVSKLEFQILDEMNDYDINDLMEKDSDVNQIQLSTIKDKEDNIKVSYKYLISSKQFFVLATVNAIVQTDKKYSKFINQNKNYKNNQNDKNNGQLRLDLAEIALSTLNSMNDKIAVYVALLSSECDLPSFLLPHFKHIDLGDNLDNNRFRKNQET